jgi:hypothetical protein
MYDIPSSGGKGTPAYFVYFPWPPFEAGLSISTFCVSFIRAEGGFLSYYLHTVYDGLSLTEIKQHQTLVSRVFNVF